MSTRRRWGATSTLGVVVFLIATTLKACSFGDSTRGQITQAQYNSITRGTYSAKVIDLVGKPFEKRDAPGGKFAFAYKMKTRVLDSKAGKVRPATDVCTFIFNKKSKLVQKPCAFFKYQ